MISMNKYYSKLEWMLTGSLKLSRPNSDLQELVNSD